MARNPLKNNFSIIILEFLKKSKGIDVALNFGAGHKAADFAQYCDSECSPTIFSKKMDKQ